MDNRIAAPVMQIERGFDFLGYHFSPAGLTMAAKTIANFIEKASRLYEQKCNAILAATALEMYVRRWVRWKNSGLIMQRGLSANDGAVDKFSLRHAYLLAA